MSMHGSRQADCVKETIYIPGVRGKREAGRQGLYVVLHLCALYMCASAVWVSLYCLDATLLRLLTCLFMYHVGAACSAVVGWESGRSDAFRGAVSA